MEAQTIFCLNSSMKRGPDRGSIQALGYVSLLALAAAIGAAVLAARLAALALAAVLAIDRLGCGSLSDCGDGENGCERDQCKSTFHGILLLDGIRHVG
jgi:hypothetical protein